MASFIKPSRSSEHIQHTDPIHVKFSELAIKPLSSDENATYQTIAECKRVPEFSDRQLDGYYMSIMEPVTSYKVSRPFTPSPDMGCLEGAHSPLWSLHPPATHPSPWGPIQRSTPKSRSNTNTPSSGAAQPQPDPKEEDYEKLGSAALLEGTVPDFIIPGPKVGRGIDTKTVCSYFNNRPRIRESAMDKAKEADIRGFFTPVNPENLVPSKCTTKATSTHNEDSDLSDVPSDLSDKDSDRDASEATQPPTNRPQSSSYRYQPVLRRRDTTIFTTPDSGVSTWEQEACLTRIPSPYQLICICHQPARTYEVALTQCVNPGCLVGWFHKECLHRAGKLKARHGAYLCEQCALAQAIREKEEKQGWTMEHAVQDEVGVPFSGREIFEEVPGVGGVKAVADLCELASLSFATGAGAHAGNGTGAGNAGKEVGVGGRRSRLSAAAKVFVPRPVVKSHAQVLSSEAAV